jgi:hypothetical protein
MTREVADAIYGRIPSAEFVRLPNNPGYWRFPCDYELNVTFLFGGIEFPIHPLDLAIQENPDDPMTLCGSTVSAT